MSNDLNSLLARVAKTDKGLADELRRQVSSLSRRREFGLNFEKHKPETVELYGRPVRPGDKVRFLAPRGSNEQVSTDAWVVSEVSGKGATRRASAC
jgi:adenine-specific DNA-methyltransferase